MSLRASRILAAGLATAVLGASAGCHTQSPSGSSAGGSGDGGSVTIMVGGLDKIIYLPAQLTESLGYFKEQGLDVKLMTQPSGANAENQLLAGQVQGVVGFYDHTTAIQAKGKCLRTVVQFANVPGEAEMVATAKAGTIKTAADLRGKKAGVTSPGSSTDFLTQYFTAKAGITTADYTTVTAGAGSTFIAAMQNGGIDVGMTTDPTITELQDKKVGQVMYDMRTEEGTRKALGGLYPAASLYMSCDYVDAHKPQVQKLANAFVKTLKFINTNDSKAIAAKMPADMKGNEDVYVRAMDASKGMFNDDGKMLDEGAQNVLNVLVQALPEVKEAKDRGSIDVSKTYTNEFVDKAK